MGHPEIDRLDHHTQGWINAAIYGAVGNGSFDNSDALGRAFTAAKAASGKTIILPDGIYACSSAITISGATGLTIAGASSSTQTSGGATILYTGTAASFLTVSGCSSFRARNVNFRYNSASFAGTLVAVPGCADAEFTACGFLGQGVAGALYLLSLDTATDVGIDNCVFDGAQYAILGQATSGAGYANGVDIRRARFGSSISAGDIRNPGQGWRVQADFESCSDGRGQAIKMSDSAEADGLDISGSWFGDATENSTGWAWLEFVGRGLSVHGNYIHGTGAPTCSGIKIMGTSSGISITGNHIENCANGVDLGSGLATQVLVAANDYASTTTRVTGTPSDKAWILDGGGGLALDVWDGGSRIFTVTAAQTNVNAGQLKLAGLQSSSPGSSSKELWYDPADGNTVKFDP